LVTRSIFASPNNTPSRLISALLVDDEVDALEVLDIQLARHCPQISVRDSFVTAAGALAAARQRQYDVAFLDIHLQRGAEGLRLGAELYNGHTKVVFVTAHERYALEAFKVRAFDYLLKPVEVSELKRVVTEILKQRTLQEEAFTIVLKDQSQQLLVVEKEIQVLVGDGSYTSVFGDDGEIIKLSSNLNSIERQLQSSFFYRCHQSYTVNLRRIASVFRSANGAELNLKNGMVIPVARRRRVELERQISRLSG